MAFINWGSHYSVGIPVMDGQHKRMAELLNQLHADIRAGLENARLRKTLDALVQISVEHFESEEQLMEGIAFPGLDKHKEEHRQLVERLNEFSARFQSEEKVPAADCQLFFRGWFLDHIQKQDRDYGVFLYNRRSKRRNDGSATPKEKTKEPVS